MSFIQSKEKDGTVSMMVSGYLPKAPKVFEKVVLFSVCYGKGKFMDCKAWTNDAVGKIAACLERHDNVAVCGVYETYTKDNGETQKQIAVDGIFPMTAITALSASAQPDETDMAAEGSWSDMDDGDGELPF